MPSALDEISCKNRADVARFTITPYASQDRDAFERLNRAWLEAMFAVEPLDAAMLADPERYILTPGGAILIGKWDGQAVATCALVRREGETPPAYECAKMSVDAAHRGKGLGRAMLERALQEARRRGASRVVIYSNRLLAPAIGLYKSAGFAEVPLDDADRLRYRRCDIRLELRP